MKSMRSIALASLCLCGVALAAPPVVKTVPWVASNPLIPHTAISGQSTVLKGTSDMQGANIEYTWDFGDGSSVVTGVVSNRYAIEATHTYTGADGTIFTARLTVEDTSTGESATKPYFVQLVDVSNPQDRLDAEVNIAIDNGLWYLHKSQSRSFTGGADIGQWSLNGFNPARTGINVNSFEANGHLRNGDPSNPYVETVSRGLNYLFQSLASRTCPLQGGRNPDSNGNNRGIYVSPWNDPYYQGGSVMDAIVASGTPGAIVPTGPFAGETFFDVIQDMCDDHAWGQYDGNLGGPANPDTGSTIDGGWRYSPNQGPDNSACQWAAIGLLAAERNWGCTIAPFVPEFLSNWLRFSQRGSDGAYGYTNSNPLSGNRLGTTPSGLVELAYIGIGRGDPLWDRAETLMRDAMNNTSTSSYNNPRRNYYGLFALVKALRLHDSDADKISEPIVLLQSSTAGVPDLDWYGAQTAAFGGSDPVNGVARTLVQDQAANGSWGSLGGWFDNYGLQTGRAILMLGQTLFESGGPVAVALANPNPAVASQVINLDGSTSFHQDAGRSLVTFEWDLDNDGTFDSTGAFATVSFPSVGDYPVTLRVTDDSNPAKTDEDTITIRVTTPPIAPTADANGPYVFCPEVPNWFLDGTGSVNPDEGQSEPGQPGDTIQAYAWDLDGDGAFDDATGAQPNVTAFFTNLGPGDYLIQLRVTDTTAASFPSSGLGDLSDVGSAIVSVKAPGECTCIEDLAARPKVTKVQLTWSDSGAHHYNVYRSTVQGGPYTFLGSTDSRYSTYLDSPVTTGTTYYYVVREADELNRELCQSNEVRVTPTARTRRARR